VHLTAAKVEVDRVVRNDAREALRDSLQLEERGLWHLGDGWDDLVAPPVVMS
jgi:hypothetical protein